MNALKSLTPIQIILGLAGLLFLVIITTTVLVGASFFVAPVISITFLGVGLLMYRATAIGRDIAAATALIGQAIAFTAALQGHPWQIDAHMLFFALLASLIVLRSIPAILVATVITAVHHLSLSFIMPSLVYPSADLVENLGRTVFHAVIVLLETGVLMTTVLFLNKLNAQTEERAAQLQDTLDQSDHARSEAEAAKTAAEELQNTAKAAQKEAEALLEERKKADALRAEAERERQQAQADYDNKIAAGIQDQEHVVDTIRHAMQRVQGGDLTTRIEDNLPDSYKDLGDAFNEALVVLDDVVTQVARQSEDMEAKVQDITSSAQDLAQRTQQQADMLKDSADGLSALTDIVAKTENTVKDADKSAQTAQTNARSSEAIVAETASAMHAIQTEAVEISQIVKVIDEIAFQTNLLALNAGVEAARAGEAGRGFAVVASEVRALAQRSSDSANSIRELIERSGEQVEAGSEKIEETVQSLASVVLAVVEISTETGKITEGAQAQTNRISKLNQQVTQLNTTTKQNATMFEDTTIACINLMSAAQTLQGLTRRFVVSDETISRSRAA